MVESQNSGGWSKFDGRQSVLELACVLDEYQPRIKGKHFASRSVFSSRSPDYIYWSHRSIFVLRQAQDERVCVFLFKSPLAPLCKKGGNCLLLSVTRVMDNLE